MEDTTNTVCPICTSDINEGEASKTCPNCSQVYHAACWEGSKGCSVCDKSVEPQADIPTHSGVICENCAEPVEQDVLSCPSCGMPRQKQGTAVSDASSSEMKQEQKSAVGEHDIEQDTEPSLLDTSVAFSSSKQRLNEKKNKIFACIGFMIVGVLALAAGSMYVQDSAPVDNFYIMCPSLDDHDYVECTPDGYTLFIRDDDKQVYASEGKKIAEELGFSQSQIDEFLPSACITEGQRAISGKKGYVFWACSKNKEYKFSNLLVFVVKDEYRRNN